MNPAGFDPSGLADSIDPTRQSRLPASQKNNPMNAASQEPGVGEKVNDFLSRMRP